MLCTAVCFSRNKSFIFVYAMWQDLYGIIFTDLSHIVNSLLYFKIFPCDHVHMETVGGVPSLLICSRNLDDSVLFRIELILRRREKEMQFSLVSISLRVIIPHLTITTGFPF